MDELIENEQNTSRAEKKKTGFFQKLLIYCIIMLGVILVAAGVWWACIDAFERSQPEHKAEQIAAGFDSYLSGVLSDKFKDNVSVYESWDRVYSELIRQSLDGEFSYVKYAKEFTSEKPVYQILCGKNEVARLKLEKGDRGAFGLQSWNVSALELTADLSGFKPFSYLVEVPCGFSVKVNGMTVPEENKDSERRYPEPGEFETDSESLPKTVTYKVDGLFLEPEITVLDPEGNEAEIEKSGNYAFCAVPERMKKKISVTAPAETLVYINGKLLGKEYLTEDGIKCPQSSEYDNAHLVKYELGGLLYLPEVGCFTESGEEIKGEKAEDGVFSFGYTETMKKDVAFAVPKGSRVTVGGKEDEIRRKTGEGILFPELAGIAVYVADDLTVDTFILKGIYGEPILSVKDENGNELEYIEDEKLGMLFLPAESEELKKEYSPLVEEYVDAYIRYTSGGYAVVETTFKEAAKYIYPASPAYNKLLSTKFSFGQNKEFFIKSREIKSYGYRWLGSNCFTVTVDFSADIYTTYTSTEQNVTDTVEGMRLWYALVGGEWKIIKLGF